MKKTIIALALALASSLAYGQTYKSVTVNGNGTVVAPANFWTGNAENIIAPGGNATFTNIHAGTLFFGPD